MPYSHICKLIDDVCHPVSDKYRYGAVHIYCNTASAIQLQKGIEFESTNTTIGVTIDIVDLGKEWEQIRFKSNSFVDVLSGAFIQAIQPGHPLY
jgi:hypothetical protein